MLKQVVLLKRRDGMSMDEFIDYYENHHAKMAKGHMPLARRYLRRYVRPEKNPITGEVVELDFDVVMEIWWNTRRDFEETMKQIGAGEAHRLFYEDEEKLFKSHNNRVFTVDEYESDMAAGLSDK
jgi:EthD domain-containing protein